MNNKYKLTIPRNLPSPTPSILQQNSEGLEHFESRSEVSTFTCSIQSQPVSILISCTALAATLHPPPPCGGIAHQCILPRNIQIQNSETQKIISICTLDFKQNTLLSDLIWICYFASFTHAASLYFAGWRSDYQYQ